MLLTTDDQEMILKAYREASSFLLKELEVVSRFFPNYIDDYKSWIPDECVFQHILKENCDDFYFSVKGNSGIKLNHFLDNKIDNSLWYPEQFEIDRDSNGQINCVYLYPNKGVCDSPERIALKNNTLTLSWGIYDCEGYGFVYPRRSRGPAYLVFTNRPNQWNAYKYECTEKVYRLDNAEITRDEFVRNYEMIHLQEYTGI